jgi:hypothetical protein
MTRRHCGHADIDRITAEAARHVRNLRRTLATGDTL